MRLFIGVVVFYFIWIPLVLQAQTDVFIEKLEISPAGPKELLLTLTGKAGGEIPVVLNQDTFIIPAPADKYRLTRETEVEHEMLLISIASSKADAQLYYVNYENRRARHIPFWLSVVPPLIAIAFALIFREVIISLFAGIWFGAFVAHGLSFKLLLTSLLNVVDKFFIQALMDPGHLSVILFSLMLGGMVAVISRNGGMAGVVESLSRYARTRTSAQFISWLLGVAIFFDDYANTLIVGNTMKPVTDRFKVSREKLAYIVDSTAAPIAAVAFITTWIGAELGYIDSAVEKLGITESAYSLFIHSLKYSYYPFFTLLFVLLIILMKRDYGSMFKAENRAVTKGELFEMTEPHKGHSTDASLSALDPVKGIPHRWYNAVIPILIVIFGTIAGLWVTGYDAEAWAASEASFISKLSAVVGNANSYVALLWSSLGGLSVALLMTIGGRIMSVAESIESMMEGVKTMLPAVVILLLAWSLADVTKELYTAQFLISLLSDNVSPYAMPAITFILASVISFATGSSWSTMAILYPLILPGTWFISKEAGLPVEEAMVIMYNVIAVVLGGSVVGDHCSPISDTTVLSSLASSCNHIDHVRTQLPYALTVGFISLLTGGIFFWMGVPWYVNYLIGIALIIACIKFIGKRLHENETPVHQKG